MATPASSKVYAWFEHRPQGFEGKWYCNGNANPTSMF